MNINVASYASKKALTQVAKKHYVKPSCEIIPIKSLFKKMEQQAGDTVLLSETAVEKLSDEKLYESLRKYFYEEEMKKISKINVFSQLKITKGLNEAEKKRCLHILNSDENSEIFYPTLYGKKPACLLSCSGKLKVLEKLNLGKNIEFVHTMPYGFSYDTYMLNKKEVMKIIKQHKTIYTTSLGLPKDAKLNDIYKKLKEFINSNPAGMYGGKHQDIVGLTLGFPKYSSMIFELENVGKIDADLRGTPEYIEKLLEVLHSSSSPYNDLPKKEIKLLEDKIKQISAEKLKDIENTGGTICGYYQYIDFVNEPQEYARIEKAVKEFQNTFSAAKL